MTEPKIPRTVAGPGFDLDAVDFVKGGGTVPVVAQDRVTGSVLMLAYADREALELSLKTGDLHFRSRTRGLWKKGETSGNVLRVVSLSLDCDADTVLAVVDPRGPACHTGAETCFGPARSEPLARLAQTIEQRAEQPEGDKPGERPSYTRRLLSDRNLRLKKLGEETAELIVALSDGDLPRSAEEAADVVFHVMVALRASNVPWDDVLSVLAERASGTVP